MCASTCTPENNLWELVLPFHQKALGNSGCQASKPVTLDAEPILLAHPFRIFSDTLQLALILFIWKHFSVFNVHMCITSTSHHTWCLYGGSGDQTDSGAFPASTLPRVCHRNELFSEHTRSSHRSGVDTQLTLCLSLVSCARTGASGL